ncbi:Protein S-acyltransferase 8 [Porphyridium purpureum]|uniref:Palmitoyltransferase n=1 Tax=Porphyridium purpureum TaxID=35688 RepID=A0A5J4Z766_PORPP|nr:Protein S-acyltransferase 8 [Porphyridium purpureum]|eukprot:POR4566..scf295_1
MVVKVGTRLDAGRCKRGAYETRSRLWWSGRALTGPDYWNAVGTLVGMLLPLGLYYGICVAWLCVYWTPAGWVVLAVSLPLSITVLVSFVLATSDDPGIIPKQSVAPPSMQGNEHVMREQTVLINDTQVVVKYCETCRHWRPPRAIHCNVCNNCVERFDHHCPWLGNCVGRRNYRSFFIFVSSTTVMLMLAIAMSAVQLVENTRRFQRIMPELSSGEAFREALGFWGSGALLVLMLYCFLGLAFAGGLTGFHLYLMWRNLTTNEFVKHTYGKHNETNPFPERGPYAIWVRVTERKTHSKIKARYGGPDTDFDVEALVLNKLAPEKISAPIKLEHANGVQLLGADQETIVNSRGGQQAPSEIAH